MSVEKDSAANQNPDAMKKDTGNADDVYDYFVKLIKVIVPISTFYGVALAMRFWWVILPRGISYENNFLYEAPVLVTIAKVALILRYPILVLALALVGLDLRDMRKKTGYWSTLPIRSACFLVVSLVLMLVNFQLHFSLVHMKLP